MKLNGPESHWFFARLQLLAPSCSIQRLLKLLINSPVFRKCPPKSHTSLVVNLCTRTAEVVPISLSSPCRNRDGWTAWKSISELLDCNSVYSWKLPTALFYPSLCTRLQAVMVQVVFTNSLAVPTTCATRAGQNIEAEMHWSFICYQTFYFPENLELFSAGFSPKQVFLLQNISILSHFS